MCWGISDLFLGVGLLVFVLATTFHCNCAILLTVAYQVPFSHLHLLVPVLLPVSGFTSFPVGLPSRCIFCPFFMFSLRICKGQATNTCALPLYVCCCSQLWGFSKPLAALGFVCCFCVSRLICHSSLSAFGGFCRFLLLALHFCFPWTVVSEALSG